MIKGIIFDLDGVLVSTDEMHYLAWKRLADELQITGFTREDNRRQRGVSRMASLEIVLEKADRVLSNILDNILRLVGNESNRTVDVSMSKVSIFT